MTVPRARKPRHRVVARPSFVSQDSPALLGLCVRKFLDVLVPRCAGDVVSVGRTVPQANPGATSGPRLGGAW